MAKCINPLFSLSAHGKFGGLIYQGGMYGPIAAVFTPQRHKPTEEQIKLNYAFGVTADNWRSLTDEEKEVYNENARGQKMSGFNLYMKTHFHENLEE